MLFLIAYPPSNYAEFNRLLESDVIVIIIVLQSVYLKELREHLFSKLEKQNYSSAETVERFNECFQLVDSFRLSYTINPDKSLIRGLVQMTLLTWTATKERLTFF